MSSRVLPISLERQIRQRVLSVYPSAMEMSCWRKQTVSVHEAHVEGGSGSSPTFSANGLLIITTLYRSLLFWRWFVARGELFYTVIVELRSYELQLFSHSLYSKYVVLAALFVVAAIPVQAAPYEQQTAPVALIAQNTGGMQLPSQVPASSLAILRKGTQLIDAGRLPDALVVFQQYVRERPADPAGYFWIGVCYDEMSNFPVAVQAYRDGISRAEQNAMDSAEMRTNLGNVYLKQNEIDQAIDSFKRAIEVNPQFGLAELNLGRAYIAKADYSSALAALDKCVELHCNLRQVSYYRAKALMASGKKEQAAAVVQQMLQDFPNGEAKNSIQQEFQSCFNK